MRSLVDAGALARRRGRWRFDHEVAVEVPPTVEKVILARDRPARPRRARRADRRVGARPPFGLPLLEGVTGGDGALREPLRELQRLDLVREGRRWPQPEYRFKHALIQEAAYRTLVGRERRRLHREAAEWLEGRTPSHADEVVGAARAPLARGRGRGRRPSTT